MKKYLKIIIPNCILRWYKIRKNLPELNQEIKFIKNKIILFSNTFVRNKQSLLASLLVVSHVLEKGITMPERRLGFGYE